MRGRSSPFSAQTTTSMGEGSHSVSTVSRKGHEEYQGERVFFVSVCNVISIASNGTVDLGGSDENCFIVGDPLRFDVTVCDKKPYFSFLSYGR